MSPGRSAIVAILGLFCASATGTPFDTHEFTLGIQKNLGQLFPLVFSNEISVALHPVTPFFLIPDLPDPLELPDFSISIDEDSELGGSLFGDLHVCNLSIVGLSTVTDEIEKVTLDPFLIVWRVAVDNLTIAGRHDVQFNFYEGDYVVTGSGEIKIKIVDLIIRFGVAPEFPAWNRIGLNPFTIDIRFDAAEIFAENFEVNGELYDLEEFNTFIKPSFEGFWPGAKLVIEKSVQEEVNELLMGCKIFDMINENFGCFSASTWSQRILSSVQATTVNSCQI